MDKSFVDDVGDSPQDGVLAEAIVQLGNTLHLQTVAEGIEQPQQVAGLRALGCQFGQGFYFAKPLADEQIDELLSSLASSSPPFGDQQLQEGAGVMSGTLVPGPSTALAGGNGNGNGNGAKAASELTRQDQRWADLERLRASHPMMDAVIDEVDGRRIRIGDDWLCDFASCNYLGFDLHPEIIESVERELWRWGTHPSWSRLLGNPRLYVEIEEQPDRPSRSARLARAPDDHDHPHLGDPGARRPGCGARRLPGAQDDLRRRGHRPGRRSHLASRPDERPRASRRGPALAAGRNMTRLFCIDGVNSMTGNIPDLPTYARICREYDTTLYVDDAHGFGVIGESPTPAMPYGLRGNSIVRYFGETYDNIVLVAGFSKSYSSLLAFLALPTAMKNHLKVAASPYLYSGPSPTASLATVLAGFRVNDAEGDDIRLALYDKSRRVLERIAQLGIRTLNSSGCPIIELPLGNSDDIDAVGRFLFDRGIYVTLAAYPLVPRSQVGFRVQVTAANGDDEIDQLNDVLGELVERFDMQRAATPG